MCFNPILCCKHTLHMSNTFQIHPHIYSNKNQTSFRKKVHPTSQQNSHCQVIKLAQVLLPLQAACLGWLTKFGYAGHAEKIWENHIWRCLLSSWPAFLITGHIPCSVQQNLPLLLYFVNETFTNVVVTVAWWKLLQKKMFSFRSQLWSNLSEVASWF